MMYIHAYTYVRNCSFRARSVKENAILSPQSVANVVMKPVVVTLALKRYVSKR